VIILNSNQSLKILILSPFIYPEPISTGKYNTFLAKALAKYGSTVEVIAFHPLYPDWKIKKTNKVIDGVKIFRGGDYFPYSRSIVLRRLQLELLFTFFVFKILLFKRKSWDIVLSVFPPSLLFFVINFLLPKSIKKVGIVHDLQGIMARVSKNPFQKIIIKSIRILERRSLKRCNKLIFVSQSMLKRAENDYRLDPTTTSFCYPFVNLNDSNYSTVLKDTFPKNYIHVVYSGALGEKQAPQILLQVFSTLLQKRPDVCCHIFSRGPWYEKLKKEKFQELNKLSFHDLVPEENLFELYLRSDVQVIPQKHDTGEGAIPSKLPNILSAGVPVFSISDPESELSKIVKESGIGEHSNSWDTNEVVQQLSDFIDKSGKNTHQDRQKIIKSYVKNNFSIDKLIMTIISS
jgi:glycosyltransferase involved in cell wall biosynthesis